MALTMHVFGLTGGIASGKSTVAARFRARNVPVMDADAYAREVVAKGSEGLAEIARTFGPGVLAKDGSLDRKALAAIAFTDEAKRRALNAIMHPRIAALSTARAKELDAKDEPLACYEAALIIESGGADIFRPLVLVSASEALQIARVSARDGATREEALQRIRAQKPLAEKAGVADHVIENTGTLEDLESRADEVLDIVIHQTGAPRERYERP